MALDSPSAYSLGYGSGAVEVTSPISNVSEVRFNRSVHGCTAHVTPGNPAGADDQFDLLAIPAVMVDPDVVVGSKDHVISVRWFHADGTAAGTSFFLTAFC